jgi:hypothetical protein
MIKHKNPRWQVLKAKRVYFPMQHNLPLKSCKGLGERKVNKGEREREEAERAREGFNKLCHTNERGWL